MADLPAHPRPTGDGRTPKRRGATRPLHQIALVRRRQRISLRTVARRIGGGVALARRQEQATTDLALSDLYKWQAALGVPVEELLLDVEGSLSRPVRERAQLVRLMKTAAALAETAGANTRTGRLVDMLRAQLVEMMPELADVQPWRAGPSRPRDAQGRVRRLLRSAATPADDDEPEGEDAVEGPVADGLRR